MEMNDPRGVADLHAHTWYSDGKHPPQDLVRMAAAAGLTHLAVTDHETVGGIAEAMSAAADAGIEVVPGIEFATRIKTIEIHVVGLWIDPENDAIAEAVASVHDERRVRAERMLAKLNALGVRIGMEDVLRVVGKGAISRPHVAQALVETGAVAKFEEAFARYLGRHGSAYVPRRNFSPAEAIKAVHDAGGVAVLAHGLIGGPGREHVARIAKEGLDAVEAVHPKLGDADRAWLRGFARKNGLGISGGSDWHGAGWSEGEIGDYAITGEELRDLETRRKRSGKETPERLPTDNGIEPRRGG